MWSSLTVDMVGMNVCGHETEYMCQRDKDCPQCDEWTTICIKKDEYMCLINAEPSLGKRVIKVMSSFELWVPRRRQYLRGICLRSRSRAHNLLES